MFPENPVIHQFLLCVDDPAVGEAALAPEIEAQFLHFPKARHDDAPDVCAMGIELARAFRTARVETATLLRGPVTGRGGW